MAQKMVWPKNENCFIDVKMFTCLAYKNTWQNKREIDIFELYKVMSSIKVPVNPLKTMMDVLTKGVI